MTSLIKSKQHNKPMTNMPSCKHTKFNEAKENSTYISTMYEKSEGAQEAKPNWHEFDSKLHFNNRTNVILHCRGMGLSVMWWYVKLI